MRLLGEVLRLAPRHGIPGEDDLDAINRAVTADEAGDDPVRWLVVMDRSAGLAVIRAMPMRTRYRRLPEGRREQA